MNNSVKTILYIIGSIAIPFLVYGPIGWCIRDIYFSKIDVSNLSLENIMMRHIVILSIVAYVYIFLLDIFIKIPEKWWMSSIASFLIAGGFFIQDFAPLTIGANILRWIMQLGAMILASFIYGAQLLRKNENV